MSLQIPNLPDITKRDPKLGEALKKVENYVTTNVAQVGGNAVQPPNFVNPGKL